MRTGGREAIFGAEALALEKIVAYASGASSICDGRESEPFAQAATYSSQDAGGGRGGRGARFPGGAPLAPVGGVLLERPGGGLRPPQLLLAEFCHAVNRDASHACAAMVAAVHRFEMKEIAPHPRRLGSGPPKAVMASLLPAAGAPGGGGGTLAWFSATGADAPGAGGRAGGGGGRVNRGGHNN